jgi:hypothetical protein
MEINSRSAANLVVLPGVHANIRDVRFHATPVGKESEMSVTIRIGAALATVVGTLLLLSAPAGAQGAEGAAVNSPGVVSGNVVQVPVDVPVNVCGNTINVVGLLNPAAGNLCVNE